MKTFTSSLVSSIFVAVFLLSAAQAQAFSQPTVISLVPTNVSPANFSVITETVPVFDWSNGRTALRVGSYTLELATRDTLKADGSFAHPVGNFTQSSLTQVQNVTFSPGLYYWHVGVKDKVTGITSWGAIWAFTINAPVVVVPPTSAPQQPPAEEPPVLKSPISALQCAGDRWKTFNNPVFLERSQCLRFVSDLHKPKEDSPVPPVTIISDPTPPRSAEIPAGEIKIDMPVTDIVKDTPPVSDTKKDEPKTEVKKDEVVVSDTPSN